LGRALGALSGIEGSPALCCEVAGFVAAAAVRLSATDNATAESVVFTIFLLWVFLPRQNTDFAESKTARGVYNETLLIAMEKKVLDS
jgi:hypothetical protein